MEDTPVTPPQAVVVVDDPVSPVPAEVPAPTAVESADVTPPAAADAAAILEHMRVLALARRAMPTPLRFPSSTPETSAPEPSPAAATTDSIAEEIPTLERLRALAERLPLLGRILDGNPTLEAGGKTYRFQMSFLSQYALMQFFKATNPQQAAERIDEVFSSGTQSQQVEALVATLKAALVRHHGELSQDDLSDVFAAMDAEELNSLFVCLGIYFQTHDGLGEYRPGRDPLVRLGDKPYCLRWTMAEAADLLREIENLSALLWPECRKVLILALKRWQPTGVSKEELDDLGWQIGLAGIRRLISGPQRKKDQVDDPNVPGPAPAGPEGGTSTPS